MAPAPLTQRWPPGPGQCGQHPEQDWVSLSQAPKGSFQSAQENTSGSYTLAPRFQGQPSAQISPGQSKGRPFCSGPSVLTLQWGDSPMRTTFRTAESSPGRPHRATPVLLGARLIEREETLRLRGTAHEFTSHKTGAEKGSPRVTRRGYSQVGPPPAASIQRSNVTVRDKKTLSQHSKPPSFHSKNTSEL